MGSTSGWQAAAEGGRGGGGASTGSTTSNTALVLSNLALPRSESTGKGSGAPGRENFPGTNTVNSLRLTSSCTAETEDTPGRVTRMTSSCGVQCDHEVTSIMDQYPIVDHVQRSDGKTLPQIHKSIKVWHLFLCCPHLWVRGVDGHTPSRVPPRLSEIDLATMHNLPLWCDLTTGV